MANNEIKLDKKATDYLKDKIGGGGSGGDSELIFGYEIINIKNKHLSVDKLIALLQKYGASGDFEYFNVGVGVDYEYLNDGIVKFYDNSSLSYETYYNTNEAISISYDSGDDLYTKLQNNKIAIEEIALGTQTSYTRYFRQIWQPLIELFTGDANPQCFKVTKQEILDLFVD